MKVFLDTNVLASALATRGLCAELFETVLAEHELVICRELLLELKRILPAKFGTPATVTREFIALITETGNMAAGAAPVPDDAPLIAAALNGGAGCFVTGDKALCELNSVAGMPILSPRQFWERMRTLRSPD